MKLNLLLTIAILIILTGCYSTEKFNGGEITDNGLFSYPRYKVRLGEIPFSKEGDYMFLFYGLPNEEMWLQMYVEGKTDSDRDILENLSTRFDAEIRIKDGDVICTASGMPSGTASDRWVLMSSIMSAAFWHNKCLKLYMKTNTEYQLNIIISEIDESTPEAMLNVMLEGGGIELP